jgi:hypothetical protein
MRGMVKYDSWETNVSDIRGKMERGEIIPDPDWQRGYIWKLKDEQLLIDSILRGLPIPKFYLTQEYDKKKGVIHYVVDGQQRINGIYRFLTNKFPVEIDKKRCYFKDLDKNQQKEILSYKLNGHFMKDYKQNDINFLFQRINRTGIKLTNMEVWNNKYYKTEVMSMVNLIYDANKAYYEKALYTEENVKRMLPKDDIIDLCNCLMHGSVEGGSRKELEAFLERKKDISVKESASIRSKFSKTIGSMKEILSNDDLQSSLFGKRTHFISLFLAISSLMGQYYLLEKREKLKEDLLDFIEDQPPKYYETIRGGIRQKSARQTRVRLLGKVVSRHGVRLDKNRLFPDIMRHRFWSQKNRVCGICGKTIDRYASCALDHKKPWAKGGRTVERNAQLSHAACNKIKRDKSEEYVL